MAKNRQPGQLRHWSGNYYARLSVSGKMKFVPPGTKIAGVTERPFFSQSYRQKMQEDCAPASQDVE